ncbi:MAG: DUF6941 family protein [Planctomycetota bacterium]|jgi:hypothetical protein
MKKSKKTPKRTNGQPKKRRPRGNRKTPLLAAAVLCERVLQEEGNVASLIRLIDTFNIVGESRSLPPGIIEFTMFLYFKSGEAKGRRRLKIISRTPKGEEIQTHERDLEFRGEQHGVSVNIISRMALKQKGLYWFDVLINDQLMTKIPLHVCYRQQQ